MLSENLYFSNNEPVLSSMLSAGIVQDTFAGEGEGKRGRQSGGEVETTGGYFYHPGRKFCAQLRNREIGNEISGEPHLHKEQLNCFYQNSNDIIWSTI